MNRFCSFFRISRLPTVTSLHVAIVALFAILAVPAQGQWLSSHRVADTAYFLFSNPPRVERYNLATRSWMAPVKLPSAPGLPSCGWVDQHGIYVTHGQKTVYRYGLSGESPKLFMNSPVRVVEILGDSKFLFLNQTDELDGRFTSINKATGVIAGRAAGYIEHNFTGASIAPSSGKIFGRSTVVSPSDIKFLGYDGSGRFTGGNDSRYHDTYPDASRTWVFPSEQRVVDSSGTMYSTAALEYLGSLGTPVTDIQFPVDGGPIVVRGKLMTGYASNLLPAGSVNLPFSPKSFFVRGGDAVIFGADTSRANGIREHVVALSDIRPPAVRRGMSPDDLAYKPDAIFLARDGTVLLVSNVNRSIFRWSPVTRKYLPTIALSKTPMYSAYAESKDLMYLVDKAGVVQSLDLSAAVPVEKPFVILPKEPFGLAVAGDYVFTSDASGAWCTHRTFTSSGVQVSEEEWNHNSSEYIWSAPAQKMFYLRDHGSPSDLMSEEINASGGAYPDLAPGAIGKTRETPLHENEPFEHPVRVSPDGSLVILGTGSMFDGATLEPLPTSLPVAATDVLWHDGKIKTLGKSGGKSVVQAWEGPSRTPGARRQIQMAPLRIFGLDQSRSVAVGLSAQGQPVFSVLDADFISVPPASLASPTGLSIMTPSPGRLSLRWSDGGGESGYIVERKSTASSNWQQLGRTGENVTHLDFGMVVAADAFDYRVTAVHGTLAPAASLPLENVVSGPPLSPRPFVVKSAGVAKMALSWQDAGLEDGYIIEIREPGLPWRSLLFPREDASVAVVSALNSNTRYEFRIAARNRLGVSTWANLAAKTKHGQGEVSVVVGKKKVELVDRDSGFNFGKMKVGEDSRTFASLRIRNVGKNELRKIKVVLSGPHPKDFEVTRLKTTKLARGEFIDVTIRFAARQHGKRVAVLEIRSTDANESPFEILMIGKGVLKKEKMSASKVAQHPDGFFQLGGGITGGEPWKAAALQQDVVAIPVKH